MPVITCTSHTGTLNQHVTGLKAESLSVLHSLGLEVPAWIVIPVDEFSDHIPLQLLEQSAAVVHEYIKTLKIDSSLINQISQWIRDNGFSKGHFAVRSSTCLSSSQTHTFAGQLKTNLFVPESEIPEAIRSAWASPFTPSASAYRAQWGLPLESIRVAVIIQKMVNPDISGISMGIDPQSGSRSVVAITATYGIYQNTNHERLDSDHFTIDFSGKHPSRISKIFEKRNQLVFNEETGSGVRSTPVTFEMRSRPALTPDQAFALAELTRTISARYGKPQILDWVISRNQFYILQSRPVSALRNIPDTTDTKPTWISPEMSFLSNDLTTPLAYSIVRAHTTEALYALCKKLAISCDTAITPRACDILGVVNGRWYLNQELSKRVACVLPFHNRTTVKNKKGGVLKGLLFSHIKFLMDFLNFLSIEKQSGTSGNRTASFDYGHICTYKTDDFLKRFEMIESKVSILWGMLVRGEYYIRTINRLLRTISAAPGNETSNVSSQALFSISRKRSVEQVEALCEIARSISGYPTIKGLFLEHTTDEICKHLALTSVVPPDTEEIALLVIRKLILKYVAKFGNAGFGNFQFEHAGFEPIIHATIRMLRTYLSAGLTDASKLCTGSRQPLHQPYEEQLPLTSRFCRTLLLRILSKLISIQHNLNTWKADLFKSIVLLLDVLGKKLYSEDDIDQSDDIKFLTIDEILDYVQGRSIIENLKTVISIRKKEYDNNRNQYVTPVRNTEAAMSHANIIEENNQQSLRSISLIEGSGNGAGCVCGKIHIADNPYCTDTTANSILVIRNSDPEWIPQLPLLKGLIIEWGTMFSEVVLSCTTLNIPCLILNEGCVRNVHDGDIVELDSMSGKAKIIADHSVFK